MNPELALYQIRARNAELDRIARLATAVPAGAGTNTGLTRARPRHGLFARLVLRRRSLRDLRPAPAARPAPCAYC